MKFISILLLTVVLSSFDCASQRIKLYDIEADPSVQLEQAVKNAMTDSKHIMLQIGGNWCPWCYRFHDFYTDDAELDSIMSANYIIINMNYDPKKHQDFFAKLGFPQRFGFPVIVILDPEGNHLHTQNSWYLEDGKDSYDKDKFKAFLKNWTPVAIDPDNYKK